MRFTVLTIFPELFGPFLEASLLGKALDKGIVQVDLVDFREHATNVHRSVDDTPYGGGAGMVLMAEPLAAALDRVMAEDPEAHKVFLTPQGRPLTQQVVSSLAGKRHVVLVCGRYEGFDERLREMYADQEISLGDFVMSGGEVAAMAVMEAVSRLVQGFVGNEDSLAEESFRDGLLEYPQYTRPEVFRGRIVPPVLLSGNHALISSWRRQKALERTALRRPDLMKEDGSSPTSELLAKRTYLALLHYPVHDRNMQVVSTALTNLDLHDIARACRTFGLAGYFVVTPIHRQQEMVERILEHWTSGHGAGLHQDRKKAMELVRVASDLMEVKKRVSKETRGSDLLLVGTTARSRKGRTLTPRTLRDLGARDERPIILVFGTGWGLTQDLLDQCDFCLEPILGLDNYNHLSVRSAVSIYLDRLFSPFRTQGRPTTIKAKEPES